MRCMITVFHMDLKPNSTQKAPKFHAWKRLCNVQQIGDVPRAAVGHEKKIRRTA